MSTNANEETRKLASKEALCAELRQAKDDVIDRFCDVAGGAATPTDAIAWCERVQKQRNELRAEVARLRATLTQYRLPSGHFVGCRREGLSDEPHDDVSFARGREPATACSPCCASARAALKA